MAKNPAAPGAAAEGRTTLERVVRMTSDRPAQIFGLKGKGKIKVGFDADLVLVDLRAEREIRDEDTLGLIGWTPYAGRKLRGVPVRTLVRGRSVFADGKVVGEPGAGKQAVGAYSGYTVSA